MRSKLLADTMRRCITLMSDKGFQNPNLELVTRVSVDSLEYFGWMNYNIAGSRKTLYSDTHGTHDNFLTDILVKIEALKSPEEEAKAAFVKSLGNLIDEGRACGVEIETLNPLTEMMKKLSHNIITDQTAYTPTDQSNDIPF